MKIAFTVPRYGEDIVGGAEELARKLAENMAARGHDVDVLTTCARDHFTWKNSVPEGFSELNGVTVRRFKAETNMFSAEYAEIHQKVCNREVVSYKDQVKWISGGLSSPALYGFIEKKGPEYDCLIFMPYLFGITFRGSSVYPKRSVLLPCLHDESFAYLDIMKTMFEQCRNVIFNTHPERELAQRLYGIKGKGTVVGCGFDKVAADPTRFRSEFKLQSPFLLYAGRREEGKNTPLLIRYFCNYIHKTGRDLKLVLIGSGKVEIPRRFRHVVVDLGLVSLSNKYNAYAAAECLCQPSVNESLSIVLLESWLQGTPALVHADCAVTRDHCSRSNGGLFFRDYAEFHECLDFLFENPDIRGKMGGNGMKYVEENYCWDEVINRLEDALKCEQSCRTR